MISSAFEDFSSTTLQAVSGTLGKLVYLAGLREPDGRYCHWGLAKRHGSTAAHATIAAAHSEIFTEVLRTPLPSLWNEVAQLASAQGSDAIGFIHQVCEKEQGLVPANLRGGSRRHFNSVLLALSSLATSPESTADRGA